MGGSSVTVNNLRVMGVDTINNVLYVRGTVPGPDGGCVRVCDAVYKQGRKNGQFDPYVNPPKFPTISAEEAMKMGVVMWEGEKEDPVAKAYKMI